MSNPIQSTPMPTGEFPSKLGGAPDSSDFAADCRRWQARSAELLEERDRLAVELAKVRCERDSYLKTVYHFMCKASTPPSSTKEELLACVGQEKPLAEFIAELEHEMRSGA